MIIKTLQLIFFILFFGVNPVFSQDLSFLQLYSLIETNDVDLVDNFLYSRKYKFVNSEKPNGRLFQVYSNGQDFIRLVYNNNKKIGVSFQTENVDQYQRLRKEMLNDQTVIFQFAETTQVGLSIVHSYDAILGSKIVKVKLISANEDGKVYYDIAFVDQIAIQPTRKTKK